MDNTKKHRKLVSELSEVDFFSQAVSKLSTSCYITEEIALPGTIRQKTHAQLVLMEENLRFSFLLSKMLT